MMKALIAAAALLTQQPGFSPPPAKPCLAQAEAADLGAYFMPALIDGAARKCSAVLPRGAFLAGPHRALSERLRQSNQGRWPRAKAAIEKVQGQKLPSLFGEEFTRKAAEATVTGIALKEIEAKDCGTASELLGAVAPLPAENFGRLFPLLIEIGAKNDERAPFRICPRAA
ncbi:hypothetical protein IC614_03600 [Allosphingosinicella flava]|uniref:Uncharacterized protein n=1 Tax=Allosphingosinicella flava TaxID=2771430 RepID=A0A7T2GKV1_9SPHN|nr:hypothetical protein [Sphingosinicella flava]QPQ55692.1 hypothetical protein IC614_03600 [Sphingosinicella flava]